jgi:hypothetical protein
MNTDAKNYVQVDNLVTRKIAGETIIVPIGKNSGELNAIYTLNPTGTKIWEMLGAAVANPLIAQSICEEYDVTLEEARKDLEEFQASLHNAGLLRFPSQSRG